MLSTKAVVAIDSLDCALTPGSKGGKLHTDLLPLLFGLGMCLVNRRERDEFKSKTDGGGGGGKGTRMMSERRTVNDCQWLENYPSKSTPAKESLVFPFLL